ncbi:kinetochore-associated Ndc80 complex subunit nuf2 [Serendipita sp. 396]|nr:kinetochore-associated Ndc80 complex subunit nuf2 [Serendipita sp. 396]KAG8827455.1 kinetochore-associated Ndc80 complex subunit nuf2 [Serendipita sp. 401]KAG9056330.1 kinetochore-associated Ndc80 complex subunit nuf2 [Serendipita sp. 407]
MAAVQHVQLHTYDALVNNIQRTIGIAVTPRDLAQPTSQLVEMLYIKFIHILFAFEFEEYLADLHHHPEPQFADAFVVKILVRYLKRIFVLTTGTSWVDGKIPVPFESVRISDITEPVAVRTKVILSALINMVNLRDGEVVLFTEATQLYFGEADRHKSSTERIEKLTTEITEQRLIADKRRKQLEDELKKKETKEQELAEVEKIRRRAKQEFKDVKRTYEEMLERQRELSQQLMEAERKNNDLKERLVRSPDRFRRELGDLADDAAEKREQVAMKDEKNRGLRAKVDKLQDIEKDLKSIEEHLMTLQIVLKERKEQLETVQSIKEGTERRKIEYRDMLANKESWEKKGEAARQRLTAYEIKIATERREIETKTGQAKEEYEQVTEERKRSDYRIDGDNARANELEKEISSIIAHAEREIHDTLGDYWRLRQQADEYMGIIAKRLHLQLPS